MKMMRISFGKGVIQTADNVVPTDSENMEMRSETLTQEVMPTLKTRRPLMIRRYFNFQQKVILKIIAVPVMLSTRGYVWYMF